MKKFNYLIIMLVLLLAMNVMGQNTQSGSVVIDDGVITSSTNLQRDLPEKFVVFEELTGCWCHWCTGGIAYSWLLHENFDNVLFIAIHCSDPMAYDEYTEATGLTGAPTADVNRIQQGIGIGQWVNAATNNSAVVPPANVSVETVWNESTRELEVNLSAYFFENLSGDYRLGGVLIEDAVTGPSPQYNQSNHYGGGTTPMYGFEKMPSDIPAYMIAYDHVARQLLGEYGGDEGSLPAFINAGETHNYSYVITVPEEWDQEYVRVIGWLTSNTGQTIQNANKSLYLPGYDNAKPKFTSTPETFAYEGVDYNYDIFTHDTDQEEMTILEVNLPDWLTFEVLGDSAAVISGSTNNIGSYSAEVSVSDGNYTIYQTWEIEVYPSGQFFPPTNLTATVFNENDVELNWDIEVLPDLLSFDIYRNGFFYDNTTEVTYEDIDVVIGTYGYYVVAVYLGGESEPTDIVSVQISPPVLAPPTNLEIEADLNNVSLNWVSPGGGGGSEYLRYDNEENTASLQIGNVAPAIRWDAGGLSDYDGYILQKIKFFVGDVASASFTLKVWEGENGSNPLVSQEISGVIAGWNEFDLDYPVTIDGTKEYWIGYDIVDGMGAYIPGYNSSIPVVDGYGNMLFYYNTWHTTSEGNWNIAGYVVDAKGNGEYLGEDLLSYNVYRNDELIANVTETDYFDENLDNGIYEYYVTALYDEGESGATNIVEVNIGETLCTPLYASGCAMGDGFMDFALNEIQNYQTGCANLTGLGWSQYLELGPAIIEPDETYTLAIGSGFNNQYATVWVDWNDNLQFEEDEIVVDNFIMIDLSTVYDVDFVVPADAPSGLHFMRGRTNWNAPCTDPCSSYTYGEAEDYMVFVSSSTETQEIPLSSGYSFVSSRIIPNNPDMLIVMADVLNDNLDFVRNSQGLMLRKIGPNWVNGIGDWIVEEGYLVKMFVDDLLTTSGTSVDPTTPISVVTGYQFVSYFPADPMDALSAFGSIIGDDLDFIRNSQGNMLRKIGPNWVNGIGDALPGEGYLVKMFAAGEIVYPEVAKSSGKVNAIPAHFRFEGGNAADPVFTLFITGLEIGDEVGAYDGEKLVGAMKVNSLNVLDNDLPVFNTINSGHGYTSGNPIILKVWSNNELVNVDFTMETVFDSYVSKVYPDEDGAFSVVNVKSSINLNNEIMVYPNPATDEINISSSEAIRNVMILNHSGQLVYDGKSEKINVSNFNSGVYIIRIKTDNGITTKKLIINK